jgi:hypothetical protein
MIAFCSGSGDRGSTSFSEFSSHFFAAALIVEVFSSAKRALRLILLRVLE